VTPIIDTGLLQTIEGDQDKKVVYASSNPQIVNVVRRHVIPTIEVGQTHITAHVAKAEIDTIRLLIIANVENKHHRVHITLIIKPIEISFNAQIKIHFVGALLIITISNEIGIFKEIKTTNLNIAPLPIPVLDQDLTKDIIIRNVTLGLDVI
jgi:hypothetical protein